MHACAAARTRAEGAEVVGGAGHHVGAQDHLDAAQGLAVRLDVEEHDLWTPREAREEGPTV
jgi:hypothetical protein